MSAPNEARAVTVVAGDTVAAIGENRKMIIFPLDQVPEMARGRGVRLQKYKDGGLSDITVFAAADGLTWRDSAGREFSATIKELADWRGNRADAGPAAAEGFPEVEPVRAGGGVGPLAERAVGLWLSGRPVAQHFAAVMPSASSCIAGCRISLTAGDTTITSA